MKAADTKFPIGVVLALAYAMSTGGLARAAVPIVSTFLIADLGLSASQFGFSVTLMIATVAAGVPLYGQLSDRLGARAVLVWRGLTAGAALVGVATSSSYLQLLLFQALLGLAISGGVPASNRVVAEAVPIGQRGLAMGSKQAGATAGVLVAGLVLPSLTALWGWRWSVAVAGGLSALTVPAILILLPRSQITAVARGETMASWRALLGSHSTRWLSAHGLTSGAGIAMVFSFLPLYAVQGVGLGPQAAGAVLSVMSVTAVISRIAWGRFSDLSGDLGRDLRLISILAVASTILIGMAAGVGAWLIWVGALAAGLSMEAWNALAGNGIISAVPVDQSGRASSVVQLAFMSGNAIGPVLFGATVDLTGSFATGWVVCAGFFTAASVVRYRPETEVSER